MEGLLTWLVLGADVGAALSSQLLSVVLSPWQWPGATGIGMGLTLAALLPGLRQPAGLGA